jgi:hypothetical protein
MRTNNERVASCLSLNDSMPEYVSPESHIEHVFYLSKLVDWHLLKYRSSKARLSGKIIAASAIEHEIDDLAQEIEKLEWTHSKDG